ncbi:unnamed protein product [Calicophoron daubneyi]|uniref:Zinc finger CW-type PWWP domain protein 1 n=1 Tax=Calicophoron daubneyi TaxID=300641 RepID=A0AAV2T387_CALDB
MLLKRTKKPTGFTQVPRNENSQNSTPLNVANTNVDLAGSHSNSIKPNDSSFVRPALTKSEHNDQPYNAGHSLGISGTAEANQIPVHRKKVSADKVPSKGLSKVTFVDFDKVVAEVLSKLEQLPTEEAYALYIAPLADTSEEQIGGSASVCSNKSYLSQKDTVYNIAERRERATHLSDNSLCTKNRLVENPPSKNTKEFAAGSSSCIGSKTCEEIYHEYFGESAGGLDSPTEEVKNIQSTHHRQSRSAEKCNQVSGSPVAQAIDSQLKSGIPAGRKEEMETDMDREFEEIVSQVLSKAKIMSVKDMFEMYIDHALSGEHDLEDCPKNSTDMKDTDEFQPPDENVPQCGTWVECVKCNKWRFLDEVGDPSELPDAWHCGLQPKYKTANSSHKKRKSDPCDEPQAPIKDDVSSGKYVYTKFTAGSVVWAKLDGYPEWPAMIDCDETGRYAEYDPTTGEVLRYLVAFLDPKGATRQRIRPARIRKFQPNVDYTSPSHNFSRRLIGSIKEAEKALKLSLKERIYKYGYPYPENQQSSGKVRETNSNNQQCSDCPLNVTTPELGEDVTPRENQGLSKQHQVTKSSENNRINKQLLTSSQKIERVQSEQGIFEKEKELRRDGRIPSPKEFPSPQLNAQPDRVPENVKCDPSAGSVKGNTYVEDLHVDHISSGAIKRSCSTPIDLAEKSDCLTKKVCTPECNCVREE